PYLRRYKRAYALGAFCILGSVFLRLMVPRILGDSFNELRRFSEEGIPTDLGSAEMESLILRSALAIFGVALLGAGLRATSRLSILGTCRRVAYDLRRVLFERLMELSPSFFVRNPTGQIMSRAINDMGNVQGLMGPVILYLAETACLYVIGISLMLSVSVPLTLIGLLPFPFFLVAARKIAVKIQTGSRQAQNSLAEVGAKVDESLSGQAVVKSMALEEIDFQRFEEHVHQYRSLNLAVTRHRAFLIPMMMSLAAISTLAVLLVGGPKVTRGELRVGDLIQLILYLGMFAGPTRTLGFVISSLRRGASALQRIRELTEAETTIPEPLDPLPLAGLDDPAAPPPQVEIRGLGITYPPLSEQPHLEGAEPPEFTGGEDVERTVLDGIHLTVPAGKTLGIV
ncbi:MAG: ABC transporter transmembrane domain-containing protein, partial [Planctomycetota bacterium]